MSSAYANPILVSADGNTAAPLERVPLSSTRTADTFDEDWLQDLLFRFPRCLPLDEIDAACVHALPVCREMGTPAGPIDVVYVTRSGKLVLVEAKLWRNPEARRKVVGQVLDYATALSRFDFDALDAQVRTARRRDAPGGPQGLLELAREHFADFDEARFCDAVSRALRHGEFLLLIVGDGIREGVGAIASFLESHGTLMFTFGLVEMAVYRTPSGERLVQPRVLAQSTIFRRIVVHVDAGGPAAADESPAEPEADNDEARELEREASRVRCEAFWTAFLDGLILDDASQERSRAARGTNQYFNLPGKKAWISAYVAPAAQSAGVYLTVSNDAVGDRLFEALQADQQQITEALGVPVHWRSDPSRHKHFVESRKAYMGEFVDSRREDVIEWLRDHTNRFVTVFRSRVRELMDAIEHESR